MLTVVFTGYAGYDALVGQTTTLARDVWVMMVPELKGFCAAHVIAPAELNLRLEQLIGLNPDGGRSRLVEIWASPGDLFRPSPDPEITDHEAELDFPGGGPFLTLSDDHVRWINALKAISYTDNGMPWTRLGYTYDWGNPDSIVGLSEFVIRKGAPVEIASVSAPADYCTPDPSSAPAITAAAIVNLAGGAAGAIAPGELIAISGERLGPETPSAPGGFRQEISGVRVYFGEERGEISYASAERLVARVPDGVRGKNTVPVWVAYRGLQSPAVRVPVVAARPAIFTGSAFVGPAVVVNADGTMNGEDRPARPGSVVALWATGLGTAAASPARYPAPRLPLRLEVGGANAPPEDLIFAGYVYPGVAQINFRIPDGAPAGRWVDVRLTAGFETSRKGVQLRLE
ncbi:MAG: hypothetical protein KIT09_00815 [Bryobacteraceae bacterium]|nr:hypothetical protein [Bryobacteraceae bacterium]